MLIATAAAPPHAGHTAQEARQLAGKLKNEGVKAFHAGHLAEAVDKLSATIDINLNDFFAHFYLGLALRDMRRYAEARQVLEVTTQLDPLYLPAYVALGDVALGQGAPGEARGWYQTALNRQATYSPALDGMGQLHEALGQDTEAVIMYRRAIEANRGFPDPYVHLGDLFMRGGRLDDAIALFREAIRFQPGFAPGYMFLGIAYGRFGRRTEATALLEEASAIEPENPDPHIALGDLFLDWDERVQAREEYDIARALGPDRFEPLSGLAELARRDGRYLEAETLLEQALSKPGIRDDERTDLLARQTRYRRERGEALISYARLQFARDAAGIEGGPVPGAPPRPLEDTDALLAYPGIENDTPEETAVAREMPLDEQARRAAQRELGYAWLGVARLRHESGDRGGALTACNEALSPLERPVDVVSECGYYALEARDWGPAQELLAEAAERDPADAYHLINLGLAFNGLGHLTSAVDAYNRAIALNPRSAEAHIYLGNAQFKLGQLEAAESAYRTALTLTQRPDVIDRVQKVLEHLQELRLRREAAEGAAEILEEFNAEDGS